jgi:hypothetical protein
LRLASICQSSPIQERKKMSLLDDSQNIPLPFVHTEHYANIGWVGSIGLGWGLFVVKVTNAECVRRSNCCRW